jgi:hypothetical protein
VAPVGDAWFATKMFGAALGNLLGREVRIPGHLGSDYVLYGASLGDRAYTMRTWRRMAARADFSVEVIDTGIPSYPPHTRGRGRLERNLVHLLFRHS